MTELMNSIAQHDQFINIALIVGGAALLLTVISFVMKTIRKACALIAAIMYLTSAGFATKANTVVQTTLEHLVPQEEVHEYMSKIKDVDLKKIDINLDGKSVEAFFENIQ